MIKLIKESDNYYTGNAFYSQGYMQQMKSNIDFLQRLYKSAQDYQMAATSESSKLFKKANDAVSGAVKSFIELLDTYDKSYLEHTVPDKSKNIIKESADGTVVLSKTNTDVFPVVDFGCYWGLLKDALDDVFVYDYINLDAIDPDEEYYDEIVELVDEKYDGRDEFYDQVLRYAPKTIQDAFNEYGIEMQVIPSSCKWYHPREYNFGDDCIEFDAKVNTAWVENKFREFSGNPDFSKFLKKEFSSYDGFISFMPDDVDSYSEILDPNSSDYWKLVSAIVGYIISLDPSIREDATEDLYEYVMSNPDFVRCSSLDIY